MPRPSPSAALLLAATMLAIPAEAQRYEDPETSRRMVEGWGQDLQRAHQEFLDGKPKKALRRVERTRRKLLEFLRGGPVTPHLYGQISFLRALVAADAGDPAAASWDFHVAMELVEGYESLDLGRYGDAGVVLEEARATRRERFAREAAPDSEPEVDPAELTPPRKTHSPAPDYPFIHRITCGQSKVVVQTIINREGKPTQPTFSEQGDPTLFFVALDAMREWRFEPARRAGEPVAVYYNLTVNFRIAGPCLPLEPQPRDPPLPAPPLS